MLTINAPLRNMLNVITSEQRITKEMFLELLNLEHPKEIFQLVEAADLVRKKQVGEIVTFVRNRNINFTNICVNHCHCKSIINQVPRNEDLINMIPFSRTA